MRSHLELAHGATYVGPRGEHGELTGEGAVVTYPSGATYAGGVFDGRRHGAGVLTLPPAPGPSQPGPGAVYDGEWLLGRRHGVGRLRTSCGGDGGNGAPPASESASRHSSATATTSRESDCYMGGFAADRKCGFGVLRDAGGGVHAGEWADDARHGVGRQLWAPEPAGGLQLQTEAVGLWRRDELCGDGVVSWYAAPSGALLGRYVGELAGGARDGSGVLY